MSDSRQCFGGPHQIYLFIIVLLAQANNSRRDDRDQREDAVEAVAKQEAESESAAQSKESKINEEDAVEPENEDPNSKS